MGEATGNDDLLATEHLLQHFPVTTTTTTMTMTTTDDDDRNDDGDDDDDDDSDGDDDDDDVGLWPYSRCPDASFCMYTTPQQYDKKFVR